MAPPTALVDDQGRPPPAELSADLFAFAAAHPRVRLAEILNHGDGELRQRVQYILAS